jgi:hypothetical protein
LAGDDADRQTATVFRAALGRAPSAAETKAIAEYRAKTEGDEDWLAGLCHLMFTFTEFTAIE